MTDTTYQNLIVGAGQGGHALAKKLAQNGQPTALVERRYTGGTCINYGCVPTKTLLASAHAAHAARSSAHLGVYADHVRVAFAEVMARKDDIVAQARSAAEKSLLDQENLDLIYGHATFADNHTLHVALREGGTRTLRAERIFVNVGTRPTQPPIEGLDSISWLDSTSAMQLPALPTHLLIVGGGYIGVEFGQMFRRFGSQVTIFESGTQLLEGEDPEAVAALTDALRQDVLHLYLKARAKRVEPLQDGGVRLHAQVDQHLQAFEGSHLLLAVGRTSNADGLRLENTGIRTDEAGFIEVNDQLETSVSGVYALGDVKGGPAFTHLAYDDQRVLADNLLGGQQRAYHDRLVPYTIFTEPQLGQVGMREEALRQQKRPYKVARLPLKNVSRAISLGKTAGLMKVVIDAKTDQLLGATIVAADGGELMTLLQVAMMGQLTYQQLRDQAFAHPTLAESVNNLFAKVETPSLSQT